jgi:hypothetical protein
MNPDPLQFTEFKKSKIISNIFLKLGGKANKKSFLKFDYVMSDAVPLVSEKLRSIIIDLASDDVQLVPAKVFQENDFIGDYYILNMLNNIDCIDFKKSKFDKEIEDFTKITLKPDSLGKHKIVKAKKYEDKNFIVTRTFVDACSKAKIKGIEFIEEPFINPLYS